MARGSPYLVALPGGGDGLAQPVRGGWRLSNTLEAGFCVDALQEALGQGWPEVFNTGQGSQFTSQGFTQALQERGVKISMGGTGTARRHHLPGAAVADGEVRRGVPESLRRRPGGPGWHRETTSGSTTT